MRITRIDFEGQAGNYATCVRKRNCRTIEVTVFTPNKPKGCDHHLQADCEEDIFSMAECLQHNLGGHRGTNSMIHDYYRELLKLSDC